MDLSPFRHLSPLSSSGKLSCTIDGNKTKWIDAAELHRVYGDAFDPNREEGAHGKNGRAVIANTVGSGAAQIQTLLDREITERNRERTQYLAQIENLKDSLATAQEGHNRATLLLESQSRRGGDWEYAIDTLKEQVAKEQKDARGEMQQWKEEAKQSEDRLKKLLRGEREKSIWARLAGK